MNDSELFNVILDKDEQVLRTYRPNKKRVWLGGGAISILFLLLFLPMMISGFIDSSGEGKEMGWFAFVFLLLYFVILIVCVKLWCKKTVYAVTNKRVIIRTGFVGVDYKSLNHGMVGAFTVNIGLLDKMLGKNTGSIAFGSMASPITGSNPSKFCFVYIERPYDVYREIKELIDELNNKTDG